MNNNKINWFQLVIMSLPIILGLYLVDGCRRECEARVCPNGEQAILLRGYCICMTPALKKGTTND